MTAVDTARQDNHVDISISHLAKHFHTAKPVLRDVSFQVKSRSSTVIIGKNGSGKSTLLRCCIRLIEPTAGAVQILQHDMIKLHRNSLRHIRGKIGFIFQRQHLVPRLSVLTNVIHGAQAYTSGPRVWLQSLANESKREEAMLCLDSVGMAAFADRRADTLSGGESQKVAIARAFMQKPKIILADEPAASLDPKAADEAMELLYHHAKQKNVTLLFVSHNVNHAMRYADRIIGLHDGVAVVDTSPGGESETSLRGFFGEL